jgi:hypothetical protein
MGAVSSETERVFTVQEAQAAVPRLRDSLARIRRAREVVIRSGRRVRETVPANGGGAEGAVLWEAIGTLRREVEALGAEGIILRDAETGLVDFPCRREGRLVYLCWRPDEDRVAHWHEVNSGFTGRRPL